MTEKQSLDHTIPDQEREFGVLENRVSQALDRARAAGADQSEASASLQGGMNVTVRMGEVETIEHNRDRGISVTVYVGSSKGHASSGDLSESSVLSCVDKALDIARFTEPDSCNGLADPDLLASEFPDLDLWHPEVMDTEAAIERALAVENAGTENAGITNSEGGSCSAGFGQSVYGSSNGFIGRSSGTRFGQVCILIAGEGESMQRDYWYDSQRSFGDLENPELTGQKAAKRTLSRMGAKKIATCELPVIFAPEVAKGLFGHFIGAISGGALYRNASFLKDTLGEQLFPQWLSIGERPLLQRGAGSAAFDGDGVATVERNIIQDGELQGYVLSTYSARRLGLQTTGNAGGVHNLCLSGPALGYDELLAEADKALFVTEVMGQGVSMVTGDYSRGASGFLVEGGKIGDAVEEVTIAGNLRDMFSGIRAIGNDVDDRSNIQSGSVLIDGLMIAGT